MRIFYASDTTPTSANILDSSKLQQETGWFPTVSLMQGLEQTWTYFEEHYNH